MGTQLRSVPGPSAAFEGGDCLPLSLNLDWKPEPCLNPWMASLTWWTWVWVNSGSWWWTGRPGVLWFMGSQRVGHDWATDLIWSEHADPDAHPPGRQSSQVFLPIADQTMSLWGFPLAVFLLSAPKGRPGQGDFKEGNLVTSSPTWKQNSLRKFFFP